MKFNSKQLKKTYKKQYKRLLKNLKKSKIVRSKAIKKVLKHKLRITVATGTLVLLFGLVLLFTIIQSQRTIGTITPPTTVSTLNLTQLENAKNLIAGYPTNISIPSLDMNIPVIPGYYYPKSKTWTLSLSDVQYATMTPEPNNTEGDTFLYGHYRPAVFAYLHHISLGASAIVTTSNNHTFTYKLYSINVVNPSNSASIFEYQGSPILTVQTCTGLLFQNRELFNFSLTKVA